LAGFPAALAAGALSGAATALAFPPHDVGLLAFFSLISSSISAFCTRIIAIWMPFASSTSGNSNFWDCVCSIRSWA